MNDMIINTNVAGQLTCRERHDHGPVEVRLSYDACNPLAIALTATSVERQGRVRRVVLRDTLIDAYGSHAAPFEHIFGAPGFVTFKVRDGLPTQVVIRIHGRELDGTTTPQVIDIITSRLEVARFLDRTLKLVPRGSERLDVDAALSQILGG